MAKAEKMICGDLAEILVKISTGTESAGLGRRAPEIKGTTKDEHSYAYSLNKQAFEGKEKDHCYSYKDRVIMNARPHSMSDDSLSDSEKSDDHYGYLLPHYQSSDSALDVTGFDSISEKCLSTENLNVKTVDVFTERCILPGKSDPDISKMTLQSSTDFVKPSSLPTSFQNELSGKRMIMDHNYSSFAKLFAEKDSSPSLSSWSPLQDHSYNLCDGGQQLVSVGLKRGRSIETVDHIDHIDLNIPETTRVSKSPFLDHTYQSEELKKLSLRKSNKSLLMMQYGNSRNTVEAGSGRTSTIGCFADNKQYKYQSRPPLCDHTYDKTDESMIRVMTSSRFRSNSFSDVGFHEHLEKSVQDVIAKSSTSTSSFASVVKAESQQIRPPFFDHTYDRNDNRSWAENDIQQRFCHGSDHVRMDDCDDYSSDSGTESLNDENCIDMAMIEDMNRESLKKDHSYDYKPKLKKR